MDGPWTHAALMLPLLEEISGGDLLGSVPSAAEVVQLLTNFGSNTINVPRQAVPPSLAAQVPCI